jgi:hypothetical protein
MSTMALFGKALLLGTGAVTGFVVALVLLALALDGRKR